MLFVALFSVGVWLMFGPKIAVNVFASGGGIGYIPMAISTKDNPKDQMSLCTE